MTLKNLEKRANSGLSTDRSGPHAITNSRGPFDSLGEQLHAIRLAYTHGSAGRFDQRLAQVNERVEKRAQPAGSSEMIPADGGFLLQPEFSADIVRRAYDTGAILSRCLQMPITKPNANGIKFPQVDEASRQNGSRLGGVSVAWINESDALPSSKPRLQLTELTANKIAGVLYLTDELMNDSDAMARWAEYAFSEELAFRLEAAIISGTGQGQGLGILNSAALIIVPKIAGQASGTVLAQNIDAILNCFWSASANSEGACWIFNQGLLSQLASLSTIVGDAGSESKLWQWATSSDQYDRLAGYDAIMSEHCPIPGQPGDLILLDASRYVVAMREQLRSEVSIHVMFNEDQSVFKFVTRVGLSPLDNRPVIPLFGSQPTSPFVCLAVR